MSRRDHELLSQIAPTIAQSADFVDYGEPWHQQLETTGRALGREDRARQVREQTEAQVAEARAEHPELADATLAFADGSTGRYYVYGEQDLRVRFFTELGLSTPPAVQRLVRDKFFADLSREHLSVLDADVLVIYGQASELQRDAAFRRLAAVREGRVVYLPTDADVANALGFSSPLSLPFALRELAPRLAAAADGSPATEVPPIPAG